MSAVRVRLVETTGFAALDRIAYLYWYDFSEFDGNDVGPDGRFEAPRLGDYEPDSGRHALFIEVEGRVAGFAMVRRLDPSADEPARHAIAEFFVMRKYRRKGVGTDVARQVFSRWPGRWRLSVLDHYPPAQSFWKATLEDLCARDLRGG